MTVVRTELTADGDTSDYGEAERQMIASVVAASLPGVVPDDVSVEVYETESNGRRRLSTVRIVIMIKVKTSDEGDAVAAALTPLVADADAATNLLTSAKIKVRSIEAPPAVTVATLSPPSVSPSPPPSASPTPPPPLVSPSPPPPVHAASPSPPPPSESPLPPPSASPTPPPPATPPAVPANEAERLQALAVSSVASSDVVFTAVGIAVGVVTLFTCISGALVGYMLLVRRRDARSAAQTAGEGTVIGQPVVTVTGVRAGADRWFIYKAPWSKGI